MRRIPSQKTGIDTPSCASADAATSTKVPRHKAAMVPRATPGQHGKQESRQSQLDGGREPAQHDVEDRLPLKDGLAEVAAQHLPCVVEEPDRERSIETELFSQRCDGFRRGVLA